MNGALSLGLAGAFVCALSGLPVALLRRQHPLADRLAALLACAGSALGLTGALLAIFGAPGEASGAWSLPGLSLAVAIDGLSALFLIPVFFVSGLAAIYGIGYAPAFGARGRGMRGFQGLLTAGMATLLLARNGVLFLVGWEVMALSAFLLIATEHQHTTTRRAAWVYLVTTHFCTLCLVAVMLLLQAPDGSLDWRPEAIAALPQAQQFVVFGLALLAFGLKAGLMPAHVWLPGAHGNAPSHVSAVLSGVLLKMGAYGVLRVAMLLAPLPASCGALVLALGAVSALLGVAATMAQDDLKRLLAYSSIENVGIVFLGIGLFLLGRAQHDPRLAALGLGGALFHVLNHALFKPLLFLCAGSFVHGAGTRQLDQLGGLWRRMPRTGACFLVGASAISGLPLLNGFCSEFVIYLGLFTVAVRPEPMLALLAAGVVGVLAMVGGLSTATFVRSVGTVCLGRPRSERAAHAHESPASMTAPLIVLAALCALVGLLPWSVVPLLDAALACCGLPAQAADLGALVPFGALSAVSLGCTAAAAALLGWLVAARRRTPPLPAVGTWDCGYSDASAGRLQYTGASFAQFAVRILDWTARESTAIRRPLGLFPAPRSFVRRTLEPLLRGWLWPLAHRLADRCQRVRFLQRGNLQVYLLYILIVLVVLLAWSAIHPLLP